MGLVDGSVPVATPETARFWEGIEREQFELPRCRGCSRFFFPPSNVCPHCSSREAAWEVVSGRGQLYSFVITHRPWPGWGSPQPMSVALVELAEGPRLVSTVVDCPQTPEALVIDMPLVAVFRVFGGKRRMLCFRPANDGAGE